MTAEAGTLESGRVKAECCMTENHKILNTRIREHAVNLEKKMLDSKLTRESHSSYVCSYVAELLALKSAVQIGL